MPLSPKSKHIPIVYRIAWIIFSIVAIWGFFADKPDFKLFLLAALVAAIAAGDVASVHKIVQAVRAINGKSK